MAVGPACRMYGNRASLGPGTSRIEDICQSLASLPGDVSLHRNIFRRWGGEDGGWGETERNLKSNSRDLRRVGQVNGFISGAVIVADCFLGDFGDAFETFYGFQK